MIRTSLRWYSAKTRNLAAKEQAVATDRRYDYVIVGAGSSGAILAYWASRV